MAERADAELAKVILGTNARKHQQVRRTDRAGAQHHPAGVDAEQLAAAFGFDADGAAVLDHDPADEDAAAHGQVQVMANRVEKRHRGADPDTIDVVRRRDAEAGGMQAVLVVGLAESGLDAGGVEGLLDRRQWARPTASDRHRPIRAVAVIVLDVEIALRFAEVRHDLFIRPFVVAEGRPGVEILGKAALHRLTVDRRPAADHPALRDVDRTLLLGDRAAQRPVVLRVRGFGIACVAEPDLVRKMLRIGVIGPRLPATTPKSPGSPRTGWPIRIRRLLRRRSPHRISWGFLRRYSADSWVRSFYRPPFPPLSQYASNGRRVCAPRNRTRTAGRRHRGRD